MQHRVHIHVYEIEQVLLVGAGYRIHGFIGKGHRIQKGLHRGFKQIHKRLFDGKLIRATQYRMFKNMKYARIISRWRFEADGESLIFVLVFQKKQARTTFFMAHQVRYAVNLGQGFALHRAKPMPCRNG